MKKTNNYKVFGALLRKKREEKRIGLREICREVQYDPSNWSKIERGILPPPDDKKILSSWAKKLRISNKNKEYQKFIDSAFLAQGIIPKTLNEKELLELLPAFLRTIRNKKPDKEDIDKLIELIKESN
ncbi:helix-turn-helix domain-containing protein [Patescibacteria group bacterium]|nr:helix-turn-helix domain-containing protein [Patescibacteria group bacterium]